MLLGLTIASAAFFAGSRWTQARVFYQAAALNVRAGLSDRRYTEPGEIARYRSLQDAIPAGEKVLVRLSKGYLLDYRRNPVYVADWPGGASLPPGLPFFKGSEAVAEYLLSKGIRHVAYSYADQCNLPRRVIEPGLTTWDRTVTEHAFDFQDNLITLMKSRITLYDDGRLVLLDLAKRNPHRTPVP